MLNNLLEQFSRVRDEWVDCAYNYLTYLPAEEEPRLYRSIGLFGVINGFVFGYFLYLFTH